MGVTTIYLVPDLGALAPAEYAQEAKAVLEELEIIHGKKRLTDLPGFYSPAHESLTPFENPVDWECGFEVCIIYGSAQKRGVPQDPAVFPRCPKCSSDVSDAYYETINDAVEFEPNKPDDEIRVRCPKCGGEYRLDELVDDVGIFLVNAYVNFDDIPGSMRLEWLAEFDKRLGVTHRCLVYWYT